jgi:DeoR family transcriptional regulator, suf operon transcriptional repressor
MVPYSPLDAASSGSPSGGHSKLRADLLLQLKKSEALTAKELSARLSASLNAVRHHLRELEGSGMVGYERRHQGVGAPTYAYRLTAAGRGLFPRRYEAALREVLDEVVRQQGRGAAVALLEARYQKLTEQLQEQLNEADAPQRIQTLAQVFSADGYMAEANVDANTASLVHHNCAVEAVAQQFPELCAAEARFLATVLGAEVQREQHILAGCNACEYRVRFKPTHPPQETL